MHLTKLLYSDEERVNWDPNGFINSIYYNRLPDGQPFCANIANTGKIVLMGLKTIAAMHQAYKFMVRVLHDFDDPNVPLAPKERHRYRMAQLERDSHLYKSDATNMSGLMNVEFLGDEYEAEDPEDEQNGHEHFMRLLEGMGIERNAPLIEDDIDPNEPLLVKAALRGQLPNVRYMLQQPGPDGWDALWRPGEKEPSRLMEQLRALDPKTVVHMEILYLLGSIVKKHGREDGPWAGK